MRMGMSVITLGALIEFWTVYPDAEAPLRAWLKHMGTNEYTSFPELHVEFASTDWVKGFVVFNIGGNKYRFIILPNFQGKRFYIEAVFTHEQYNEWRPE
jgi:mRNA interferase HigB